MGVLLQQVWEKQHHIFQHSSSYYDKLGLIPQLIESDIQWFWHFWWYTCWCLQHFFYCMSGVSTIHSLPQREITHNLCQCCKSYHHVLNLYSQAQFLKRYATDHCQDPNIWARTLFPRHDFSSMHSWNIFVTLGIANARIFKRSAWRHLKARSFLGGGDPRQRQLPLFDQKSAVPSLQNIESRDNSTPPFKDILYTVYLWWQIFGWKIACTPPFRSLSARAESFLSIPSSICPVGL